jgi:hypothetical protein
MKAKYHTIITFLKSNHKATETGKCDAPNKVVIRNCKSNKERGNTTEKRRTTLVDKTLHRTTED